MAMNLDDILKDAVPAQRTVPICLRGDLYAQMDQLNKELEERQAVSDSLGDKELAAIVKKLEAVTAEVEANTHHFVVQAIGDERWSNIAADNRPTKKQIDAGEQITPEYVIAVVAACVVDPPLSMDDAKRLRDALSSNQWGELFSACLVANVGKVPTPKSVSKPRR